MAHSSVYPLKPGVLAAEFIMTTVFTYCVLDNIDIAGSQVFTRTFSFQIVHIRGMQYQSNMVFLPV